ncbi:hypothetical protein [Dinghuibacter silviterrae]|uniref:Uncharacterized protein n=1 Tax=Dinghuibacter silviterrae TaxID=1539049 RepID=A0A4R8DTJ3_9BACT|nr:hypothetical protein [Dinghuibacter silviterrae]TDX01614.1 hypothetical protein EDB95_2655 [Dinghuibacter silviterrae]
MNLSHYAGRLACTIAILAFGLVSKATPAPSDFGDHPYYLHALSDLRAARWMLQHRPGNWDQTVDEVEAVRQIDAAIGEIKKASIDDGKNLEDHPPVDEHPDHPGRLHDAVDFLKKARRDISHDEDNAFAQGLQMRAYDHIDRALGAVRRAIHANGW